MSVTFQPQFTKERVEVETCCTDPECQFCAGSNRFEVHVTENSINMANGNAKTMAMIAGIPFEWMGSMEFQDLIPVAARLRSVIGCASEVDADLELQRDVENAEAAADYANGRGCRWVNSRRDDYLAERGQVFDDGTVSYWPGY